MARKNYRNTEGPKVSAYEKVVASILEELDRGAVPWRRPWTNAGIAPTSLGTGKAYRGYNLLALSIQARESAFWVTYAQAKKLGGHVKKGEKGTSVILWKPRVLVDGSNEPIRDPETGRQIRQLLTRTFTVFNAGQCEGLETPAAPELAQWDPLERGEAIATGWSGAPPIRHTTSGKACYKLMADYIEMPLKGQFDSPEAYYRVLFHELTHATGASHRLNRTFGAKKGDRQYAIEELVAEIGACFLLSAAGIEVETPSSAAYIDNWRQTLGSDPAIIVTAAQRAQKAADMILGIAKPAEDRIAA